MKMMRSFLCAAAIALGAGGCCCDPALPSAEEAAALPEVRKELQSVRIVFSVKSEDLQEPASFTIRAALPASVRFDFTAKGAVFSAGFHDQQTWGYDNASGVYALAPEEEAELCGSLFLIPLDLQVKPPYGKMQWVKDETIDGEEYGCFQSAPEKGGLAPIRVWVHKKTDLLYKVEAEDGLYTYVTLFADYQNYGGVQLPSEIYMSDGENGLTVMHVESVDWNLPLDPSVFERPVPLKK